MFIAKVAHISLKDISTITRRYNGEEEAKSETDKHLYINSRAYNLFKENKDLVDVAITLDVEANEVLDLHTDYLQLSNKDRLMSIYREMGDEIHILARLYRELKWHGLANPHDMSNILQQEEKLKNLDKVMYETADEIDRLNSIKTQLEKEVEARIEMIGYLDSVLFREDKENS